MLARKAISGSTGKTECACSEVSLDAVAKAKAKIRENRVARGIDWGKQNAPAQSRARLDGAGGTQLFAQTEFRTRAVAEPMLIRVLLLWMSILPLSLAQSGDASGASASGSQPVKSGAAPAKPVPPLAPEQQARFEAGRDLFHKLCRLSSTTWAWPGRIGPASGRVRMGAGIEQRLIRIALHGLRGPITVKASPTNSKCRPWEF